MVVGAARTGQQLTAAWAGIQWLRLPSTGSEPRDRNPSRRRRSTRCCILRLERLLAGSPPPGDASASDPTKRSSWASQKLAMQGGGVGSLTLHGSHEDWISGLPEGLLLDVLGHLGSAREAARTSLISRRWRGLWVELRELTFTFRGIRTDALEIALAQVRPGLHRLDISNLEDVDDDKEWDVVSTSERLSSLLRAADRLTPAELIVKIDTMFYWLKFEYCKLPCFGRATLIDLYLPGESNVVLPPAGEFACLEQLNMTLGFVDLNELIRRCPRLRKLQVNFRCWTRNTVCIESNSLEELDLYCLPTKGVVIVAPELTKFVFQFGYSGESAISLSSPKLEDFFLMYYDEYLDVGYGNNWFLERLQMETCWSDRHKQLSMSIFYAQREGTVYKRTFAQEVARLPVNQFSVLMISIATEGHVFAPLLLQLFFIRTSIQRLKLVLKDNLKCSDNCDCDQDGSWRNERISLPDLEDVEIEGFSAADYEVDFLELVFGSAPMLKRINVKLSAEVPPGDGGCQKLRSIFQANACVECNVYD